MPNRFDEIKPLIARADEHLTWIRQALAGPHQANVIPDYADMALRRSLLENFLDQLVVEIKIRIGEFTNSLRNPLNYVACAFADLDSGSVSNQVQFPIEDDPTVFAKRRNTFLKGINNQHVILIEKCQPYHGWNSMKLLRDLSNCYKHRGLILVHKEPHYIEWIKAESEALSPKFAISLDTWQDRQGLAHVQPHIPFKVTLPDQTPIMLVLEEIQHSVTTMLCDFKSFL